MEKVKNNLGVIAVVLLSFFALKPLFNSGYFFVHDSLHVERIYEMSQALRDGHFPVRWVKDLGYGYGYPLFNFYAPLPYYVGSLFYLLGFSLVVCAKIMFGIGIILAGVSMFFLGRKIWGIWGGILSAVLYQYLPYHAVQIYVRGSVGEYWSYALLPLLVFSLLELTNNIIKLRAFDKPLSKRWVIIGAFSYSGIILSHNISALIITGLLFFFVGAQILIALFGEKSQWSTVKGQLLVLVFGLSLSAFFWIPAFVEKDLTQVNKVIQGGSYYADHFVELPQLWNSPWGYAGSAPPGETDGMSFKLGKIHIILALIGYGIVLFRRKISNFKFQISNFALVLFLISIFMMLPISQPIYDSIQILQFIQFPWRFLMFAGFPLSILGGEAMSFVEKYSVWLKAGLLLFITFLLIVNVRALPERLEIAHFKPEKYFSANDNDFINDHNLKWIDSKRSDEYLYKDFILPEKETQIAKKRLSPKKSLNLTIAKNKTHVLEFFSHSEKQKDLFVNIGYFPGWKIYVDRVEKEIEILDRGFLLNIPSGEHEVMIRFEDSLVRRVGNIISLLSILFIITVLIRKNG